MRTLRRRCRRYQSLESWWKRNLAFRTFSVDVRFHYLLKLNVSPAEDLLFVCLRVVIMLQERDSVASRAEITDGCEIRANVRACWARSGPPVGTHGLVDFRAVTMEECWPLLLSVLQNDLLQQIAKGAGKINALQQWGNVHDWYAQRKNDSGVLVSSTSTIICDT